MKKWWKLAFLLFANFDNKEWVSWLQLMFHIKWWVFLIIKKSCFHIYNTFECHFKPNQKSRSDMTDPVHIDVSKYFPKTVVFSLSTFLSNSYHFRPIIFNHQWSKIKSIKKWEVAGILMSFLRDMITWNPICICLWSVRANT